MADCSMLFADFNATIKLSDQKRAMLILVRDDLRRRMLNRYGLLSRNEIGEHQMDFQTQGSFVMDTIITPYDDDFDLDDGVYFLGVLSKERRPTPENFHNWVMYAIGEEEDYGTVTDKDTCVRFRNKKEKFHIDLPIYYANNSNDPDLAHKKDGWILSNPVKFIAWFEQIAGSGFQESFILETRMFNEYEKWLGDIRKNDVQLRRIVRYLKAWADILRGDMPPGIAMTILAATNYRAEGKNDDVALRDTLVRIRQYLNNNGGKCPRPTTPVGEDLFADYSATRKQYFLDRLDTFIESANQAINSNNQKEACLKWQKHFGNRFLCALAKDEIINANTYTKPAILTQNAKSA